jgi:hypothetical protein
MFDLTDGETAHRNNESDEPEEGWSRHAAEQHRQSRATRRASSRSLPVHSLSSLALTEGSATTHGLHGTSYAPPADLRQITATDAHDGLGAC